MKTSRSITLPLPRDESIRRGSGMIVGELVIPCRQGELGEHLKGPTYIYDGIDAHSMRAYRCPYCGQTGPRRKPLEAHMGMKMNTPASCRVIRMQDAARRNAREIQ